MVGAEDARGLVESFIKEHSPPIEATERRGALARAAPYEPRPPSRPLRTTQPLSRWRGPGSNLSNQGLKWPVKSMNHSRPPRPQGTAHRSTGAKFYDESFSDLDREAA